MNRATSALSFEQVVLPHLDAAYNLARWLMHDATAAEDAVQDACLRALKYFETFHGDDGRAWLLQIVRNTAYTKLKRSRPCVEVALGSYGELSDEGRGMEVPDPEPDPEAKLVHRQELAQLEEALAAMPVELRECLVLCELEQLSYKDIARITEVPVGTVMSRLWRARRMLARTQLAGGLEWRRKTA